MNSETPKYKHSMESVPAIPWKIEWHTKRIAYIGPQIERLLDWRRESWTTMDIWIKRIHPLDRDRVLALQVDQMEAGVNYETEYAVLTSSGDYVLVHDIVHVACNPEGKVEALMGFLRRVRPS